MEKSGYEEWLIERGLSTKRERNTGMNAETKKWVATTLSHLFLAQMAFNEDCFTEVTVGLEPNIANELRLSVQRAHDRTIGEKLSEQDGHSLNWEEIRRLNDVLETYYRKLREKIKSVVASLNNG